MRMKGVFMYERACFAALTPPVRALSPPGYSSGVNYRELYAQRQEVVGEALADGD
ncbi:MULTISPECIES: hypothetical protein [unclassified Leucobacter]|uniref:hypothetical protein n=1 Tax=unclassified Leucobacter TaxID=2621730 RepID=UPI001BFEBFCF|nr:MULTISPECIES: hypothetical protein [unclassified Leucobacter]